jgi:hypothetical protein
MGDSADGVTLAEPVGPPSRPSERSLQASACNCLSIAAPPTLCGASMSSSSVGW